VSVEPETQQWQQPVSLLPERERQWPGLGATGETGGGSRAGADAAPAGPTVVAFNPQASFATAGHFFDFPFPSDLRRTAAGNPDLTGYPNPGPSGSVEQLRKSAALNTGFSVVPVAYFSFSAPLPAHARRASDLSRRVLDDRIRPPAIAE
jgi:hypothetical protein